MLRIHQRLFFSLSLLALLFCLSGSVPSAKSQDSAVEPPATVTANEVKDVADELWCPLCSGVRLDACELKACEQMREVIADKLPAGEPKDDIKNYFVAQYGPQVLGEPPLEGFNWLAWLLPVAVMIGGGVFVWRRMRGMIASKTTEPPPSPAAANNEYYDRLEEELKRYD